MALCPKCGQQELRSGEKLCPHCKNKRQNTTAKIIEGAVFVGGVIFAILTGRTPRR